MPPAPEPGKVGGKEGGLEVFGQVQAQQKAGGPGQFGIPAEVEDATIANAAISNINNGDKSIPYI